MKNSILIYKYVYGVNIFGDNIFEGSIPNTKIQIFINLGRI